MPVKSFKSFTSRQNRALFEVKVKPYQGQLFAPPNFPNTGHVLYTVKGVDHVIVASRAQMANFLEQVCLNADKRGPSPTLGGISYIEVRNKEDDTFKTTSLQASHRIAEKYVLDGDLPDGTSFLDLFNQLCGVKKGTLLYGPPFYRALVWFDACAALHGSFLVQCNAQMQVTRVLSGMIEAHNAALVHVGGAKINTLDMAGADKGKDDKGGTGNVPFTKVYATGDIVASFSIDLHLLRSFQLPEEVNEMLFTLALWKIQMFLTEGLRLRSECDLEVVGELQCTNLDFQVPSLEELEAVLPGLIEQCKPYMNGRTVVYYTTPIPQPKKKDEKGEKGEKGESQGEEG